jgi:hypothetical protein
MREPQWIIGFDMNTTRYVLALFLVITLPPLFLYWLLIHPFVLMRQVSVRPTMIPV